MTVNDTLMTLLIASVCVVFSAIIGLLVLYAIYRKLSAPKPRTNWAKERAKFEKTSSKLDRKRPNPLLYALATACLLVVLYLIFFTDNWPLVVLFALIGLAFSSAARK
jgi:ABC-type spermidine/putrescine transport system permease subunit II